MASISLVSRILLFHEPGMQNVRNSENTVILQSALCEKDVFFIEIHQLSTWRFTGTEILESEKKLAFFISTIDGNIFYIVPHLEQPRFCAEGI